VTVFRCDIALLSIVVAAQLASGQAPKLEPVSKRLKRELFHPNKAATLVGIRFSPDGKELVAGDYPNGTVQLWDVGTGRRLTQIETGRDHGRWDYFFVSPDWKTIFANDEQLNARFSDWHNDVRAWDLQSGRLRGSYKHEPPGRFIRSMELSPDGSTFVTLELSSVGMETKWHASLWSVESKRFRSLPGLFRLEKTDGAVVYSPDGKLLAAQIETDDRKSVAVHVFDVATARLKTSIPTNGKSSPQIDCLRFSPDSKVLAGWVFEDAKPLRNSLKLWDASTGRELDSLSSDKTDFFWMPAFHTTYSPYARMLAISTMNEKELGKLFLFNTSDNKLVKAFVLDAKIGLSAPVFSPDGKWIAVGAQKVSATPLRTVQSVEELEQPRVHLVDVATGAIRETLVAPPSYAGSICFSPDGRMLAVGSQGRVLLFDLTTPPK